MNSAALKLHIHYELSFVGQGITVCSGLGESFTPRPPLSPQFAMVGLVDLDDFDHEKKSFLFLSFFFFYFNTCDLKPWRPARAMGWRALGLLLEANYLCSTSGRIPPPNIYVYIHMCTCMYVCVYIYAYMYLERKDLPCGSWKKNCWNFFLAA